MKVERRADEVVIYLPQRLDMNNSSQVKEEVLSLLNEGVNIIACDFSNVQMIDSSGIGKLLFFQKNAKENNTELLIRNIKDDYVRKVIKLIHLDEIIKIEEEG